MLFADKEALETDLKVSLLAIRERELNLYVQNCRSISTQTSVLAGFAYGGCCLGSYLFPEDVSEGMQASYLVATIWAMALNVFCIFSATLCTMLGPGLALRGPDGSMEQAVEGLAIEYRFTFVVYFMGLMMFFLAAILFVFLMFDSFLASLLAVLIIIFVVNMLRACKRIYKRFRLPMHQAVAGNFNPDGTLGASINESQSSDARRLEQVAALPPPSHLPHLIALIAIGCRAPSPSHLPHSIARADAVSVPRVPFAPGRRYGVYYY